ncbi:MAG: FeoB-associated Cys-rich membrane protein [Nitrospirae bacterium]|nr:FeoB-associated Cys-rich membrane protein [Nitrospirota bacterium]
MAASDYFWITVIVSGAVYILYRSMFKKGSAGGCHDCGSSGCSKKPHVKE